MSHIFRHDDFYGRLQLRKTVPGFTLAHRVADRPPDQVQTHTHVEAHFVLVTSGQYISSAEGTTDGLLPLVYNPPGTTHRDHFRHGAGSFFTVSVAADRFLKDAISGSRPSASFLVDGRCRGLARALLWESTRGHHGSRLHLESLSLELLDAIPKRDRSRVLRSPVRKPQWLDRAYELLQDSYAQALTVRELAFAVGVHPIHLARTFRSYFRCTPGQLIQLRRLEKTADLLLFSAMPLTDIAITCGFTDQSHMTTSFRRVYGLAPGRFRKVVCRHGPLPESYVSFLQDARARL